MELTNYKNLQNNTSKIRNYEPLNHLRLLFSLCFGVLWFPIPLDHFNFSKHRVEKLVENCCLDFKSFEFPCTVVFVCAVQKVELEARRTTDATVPSVPHSFFGRIQEKAKTTLCSLHTIPNAQAVLNTFDKNSMARLCYWLKYFHPKFGTNLHQNTLGISIYFCFLKCSSVQYTSCEKSTFFH